MTGLVGRESRRLVLILVWDPGRPLAVRSRTENTVWSAHVVQALISIPAIRRAIDGIDPENLNPVLFGERESGWHVWEADQCSG